jgi:hypothetical protein
MVESVVHRIKQWLWLIFLLLTVVAVVTIAYYLTPNAEPLDGASTLGSLVLTVFLVYIYSQQNKIMKNQEEILEQQRETQEAADVSPFLHFKQPNFEREGVQIDVENTGSGSAYDVYLVNKIVDVSGVNQIQGTTWKRELAHHHPAGESKSYQSPIRFAIQQTGEDERIRDRVISRFQDTKSIVQVRDYEETESWEFESLSEYIYNNSEATPGEKIEIEFKLSVVYYDSIDNQHKESLKTISCSISGLSGIDIEHNDVYQISPQLEVEELDRLPGGGWGLDHNTLGMEIKNRQYFGSSTAHSINACSLIQIQIDESIIDIGDYIEQSEVDIDIRTKELESNGRIPDKLLPGSKDLFVYQYRVSVDGKSTTIDEALSELIAKEIDYPILIGVKVRYTDSIGEEYELKTIIRGVYYGEQLPETVDSQKYIQQEEPMNIKELLSTDVDPRS